ncbi:LPP20 family lipoprotein [Marinobacter sp. F3R08]|uniref:LPP20 family lipoprotein n=1 Tax=Marinobacter sp. F3R08 TaxID=2841559 RepID=UPI001C090B5D|nr:LPP20 family lipoprotein [Marinobacter sp. F3R08]MBU2952320.1 LPP20 family lipoprotein [Marinobacter sp. F3R08]
MNMKVAIVVSALSIGLLGGCASNQSALDLAEQQAEIEAERAEMLAELMELKNEQLEESLSNVPDWVIEPPKPDVAGIYGVGVAESSNVAVVMKKARLQAEYELAAQMKQEISGLDQQFIEDSSGNDANLRFQSAVERFVNSVEIAGQEIVEQEVDVSNGKYDGYVLMRLSFDSMERMLEERNNMEGYDRMKAAFKELRERVEASKQSTSVLADSVETTEGA